MCDLGCKCMDCYEAGKLNQLAEEMLELRARLTNASLDDSQRTATQTRIRSLENEQDRRHRQPVYTL